jgi:ABC-type sugar transport system substrate-binding protein
MKKQYIKNLLGVLLVMMVGLTAASAKEKGPKVGMAVQDLSNPTWANPRVEV